MSAQGDQAVVAEGEVTEKTTEAASKVAESDPPAADCGNTDSPNTEATGTESDKPQVNGVTDSDTADTEADQPQVNGVRDTEPDKPPAEQPSPPATPPAEEPSSPSPAVDEQKPSDEVKAEAEPAGEPEVAASPPPQIVVDTVPDRDPESPATPEAPKENDAAPVSVDDKAEAKVDEPEKPAASEAEPAESPKTNDVKVEGTEPETKEDGEAPVVAVADAEEPKPAEDGAAESAAATPGKPDFNGKYKQLESENVEAFMHAIGMPWLMRKMATKVSPSTEIRQEGDKFHIKLITGFMTKETKFTMGEETEDGGFGWKKETSKVKAEWDGNKIVMVSEPKNEKSKSKPVKVTRELDENKLTMTLETGDVVSKRVFERKK